MYGVRGIGFIYKKRYKINNIQVKSMEYLIAFIECFVIITLNEQLALFRSALLCFIDTGALILCCASISGHLSIDLNILGSRNLELIKIYKAVKEPRMLHLIRT